MRRISLLALVLLFAAPGVPKAVAQEAPATPAEAPNPVDVPGFWTDPELAAIDEGLDAVNASRADLGFFKRPIEDPFRLDVVNRALDEPLSMGREAAEWDETARRGDAHRLFAQARAQFPDRWPAGDYPFYEVPCDDIVAVLSPDVRKPLRHVLSHAARRAASIALVRAYPNEHKPSDAEILRKALHSQMGDVPSAETARDIADGDLLAVAQSIVFEDYFEDASGVLTYLPNLVSALRTAHLSTTGRNEFKTSAGTVLVYGTGDDLHPADEDAILVIDLGGNDTYLRGASASVEQKRPFSVVIDLSGDDRYVGENDFSFGGALGGVAIQWDCGGNDTYRAGNCSLGAGILGVGVLVDEGGDDVFRAKDFCEGAGAFGIGILLKKGGNDLYHADLYGQGFASTWGCGVLADLGGNDVYDAGGAHLHEPLYRDRYTALSQGFAIGMRPDASGGVGVLVDVSGNDRYQTDIYGQGSSYWYSLGLLIDDDGHDTYNGTHYCQGTGIHLSAGMLLDRAGNDSYHCLNGVGVGGSHDFAAGILLDRSGDDHYSGSGVSQGCGHTNGVGILLDGGGDDGYCAVHGSSQGFATTVRGTGGIGLLLDQGGKDVYSESTRDDAVWVEGTVGAGIDRPSETPAGPGGPQAPIITKDAAAAKVEAECKTEKDGKRDWDLDKLWAMSSEWAVNDNSVIVPIAREQFVALGDPAVDRAFERLRMCGIGSGLEFEAVQDVMKRLAATDRKAAIQTRLLEKTKDEDDLTRRGAVSVIASLQVADAVPRLIEMLKTDEKNRRSIIGALGVLKQAPPEVAGYLRSKAELEGVNAASCLGGVGDDASLATLTAALGPDVPFLTRTAVTEQLATLAAETVPPAANAAIPADPKAAPAPTERAGRAVAALAKVARDESLPAMSRRNALRALGRSGHAHAVDPIVDAFLSKDRWVRFSAFQAARALIAKSNEVDAAELRVSLDAARAIEKDPFVRRLR
ncbi:MAG: hypothetical protein K8T90_20415 [Planctomycetes bacterium]|nr:hypothetical protein [Planctomycetota bacterium]